MRRPLRLVACIVAVAPGWPGVAQPWSKSAGARVTLGPVTLRVPALRTAVSG